MIRFKFNIINTRNIFHNIRCQLKCLCELLFFWETLMIISLFKYYNFSSY